MKTRVLFVDDDLLVLDGLRRALRPMREEWEMSFVDSGPLALQMLAQAEFDVVVADMRMPGMNGAELLAEILKRHPKTVRLILSGHADRELVLKCVGSTHQYLSKPCDPEELKAVIRRAGNLEESFRDQNIRRLVTRMDTLPSIPALYTEIVDKLRNPDTDVEDIGETVSRDVAMTAKILKLVNSAFFGLGREISSPVEAVAYLGMDTIKALVLSIHAFSQFSSAKPGGFSIQELWSHSQNTAAVAKKIAKMECADLKLANEAFVAGLLHDLGKLVLASNFCSEYDALITSCASAGPARLAAEERTFGANHAEVGGYLLGLWGLPVPVVEAITLHHEPSKSSHLQFSPLSAVHVADALVNASESSGSSPDELLDSSYLAKLGIQGRLETWRGVLNPQFHPDAV